VQTDLGVDDEQQQVGLADRLVHLSSNLDVHRKTWIVRDAAGVDKPKLAAGPIGLREVPISSRACFLGDDGAVVADNAIE
jgi:hypothetical protein